MIEGLTDWVAFGALYEYLLRIPRRGLDLLAGSVPLASESYFLLDGILLAVQEGS